MRGLKQIARIAAVAAIVAGGTTVGASTAFRGSNKVFACSYSASGKTYISDGSNLGYVEVWHSSDCGGWYTETVSYGGQPTYAEIDFYENGGWQNHGSNTCNALTCNSPSTNAGPDGFMGVGCIWVVGVNQYYCANTPGV